MKNKIDKIGEILLKRPEQPNSSIFGGFAQQLAIPNFEKLVFIDKDKEKEWEELDEDQKDFIMKNLRETAMLAESKIAIEMLCNVINDMNERIKKTEANNDKER